MPSDTKSDKRKPVELYETERRYHRLFSNCATLTADLLKPPGSPSLVSCFANVPGMCRATGVRELAEPPQQVLARIDPRHRGSKELVWLMYVCERVRRVDELCHFKDIRAWFDRKATYLIALSFPLHVGMVFVDADVSGDRGIMTFGIGAPVDRRYASFMCPDLVIRTVFGGIEDHLEHVNGTVANVLAVLRLRDERSWLLDKLLSSRPLVDAESQFLESDMLTLSLVRHGLSFGTLGMTSSAGSPGTATTLGARQAVHLHRDTKVVLDSMRHTDLFRGIMQGRV
jgi:hypothetical protein